MLKIATIMSYKKNYSLTKAVTVILCVCDFFKYFKLKNKKK